MRASHEEKIAAAFKAVDKHFGKGVITPVVGGTFEAVPSISTGEPTLDEAIGCGGFPCGRVIEILGAEPKGVTFLIMRAIAAAQQAGHVCALIDVEHAFDPIAAQAMGIDLSKLLVSQPDCAEQALEVADTLVKTGAVDLIILDSVGKLTPRAEIEGDYHSGGEGVGLQARLLSQAMRKLTAAACRTKAAVIFVNRLGARRVPYGAAQTGPGNALKFYASLRIELRKARDILDGEKVVGEVVQAKILKNKVGAPFTECEFQVRS